MADSNFESLARIISDMQSKRKSNKYAPSELDMSRALILQNTPDLRSISSYKLHASGYQPPISSVSLGMAPSVKAPVKESPSFFQRTLDVLSRPAYAAGSAFQTLFKKQKEGLATGKNSFFDHIGRIPEVAGAAIEGLEGHNKVMPSQAIYSEPLLAKHLPKSGVGRFATGLAMDVALDPSTWVPGAAIAKPFTVAKRAIQGYKPLEAPVSKAGKLPSSLNRISLPSVLAPKLSDIEATPGIGSVVRGMVEGSSPLMGQKAKDAKAANIVVESGMAKAGIDRVISQKAIAESFLPPVSAKQVSDNTLAEVQKALRGAGISSTTRKMTADTAKKAILGGFTKPQQVATKHSKLLESATRHGWSPDTNLVRREQTRALEPYVGPVTDVSYKGVESGWNPVKRFAYRMGVHLGNRELTDQAVSSMATGLALGEKIAKSVMQEVKVLDPEALSKAMSYVQGKVPTELQDMALVSAANNLRNFMHRYAIDSGITNSAVKSNVVPLRVGATQTEINKELAHMGSLRKLISDPKSGDKFDFLKSWEDWENLTPKDIVDLSSAISKVTSKAAFHDEVAELFGKVKPDGQYRYTVKSIPRLKGYYFTKEISENLVKADHIFNDIYNPKSAFAKFVRRTTALWKKGVTIYNPAHHIRNFMGDTFNSWLAGVKDPRVFSDAIKLINSQKHLYKDLDQVTGLAGKDALKRVMDQPGDLLLKTKGGLSLTNQQAYTVAFKAGILQDAHVLEDLFGDEKWIRPFKGKVSDAASSVSKLNNDVSRLAHFIDIARKSSAKTPEQLVKEVGPIIRKYHPDSLDLTSLEKSIRNVIPFYSWTRKMMPVMLEHTAITPGKLMVYPKAQFNLQQAMGMDPPSISDQMPANEMLPPWLKNAGIGPVSPGMVINPELPWSGLLGDMSDPLGMFKGMLTPLAKIPIEVGTGKTFSGRDISKDPLRYGLEQIPVVSTGSRIANFDARETEGMFDPSALINTLTAAGISKYDPVKAKERFSSAERGKENAAIKEWAGKKWPGVDWSGGIPKEVRSRYYQEKGIPEVKAPKKMPSQKAEEKAENDKIRLWLMRNGYPVSESSRIPEKFKEVYYQNMGAN